MTFSRDHQYLHISFSILIFLIGLTLVAHLIWWVERDDDIAHAFSTNYKKGIIDTYWWAVVTMTTVGYGDKCPQRTSGKLVAAIWLLIGIMWFAGFRAKLSSTLTNDLLHPVKINSLADLTHHKVAVILGTTTEDYLRYHNIDMVAVDSLEKMLNLLKKEEVSAIIYDAPPLLYTAKFDPDVRVVGDIFAKQRYGVVFPEAGQDLLKEVFNQEIIIMRQNGEYQRIYDKWLK